MYHFSNNCVDGNFRFDDTLNRLNNNKYRECFLIENQDKLENEGLKCTQYRRNSVPAIWEIMHTSKTLFTA